MLHAVIMAGGSGTRFWPASRRALPKQFLTLTGNRTLLQQAVDRCLPWISAERLWIVTNAAHVAETHRQLPELPAANILREPCGRNTAPCIGLAALHLLHTDAQATMLVMPSDHIIRPVEAFRETIDAAAAFVERQPLASVLLGIPPTYPATGFGYIERGEPLHEVAKRSLTSPSRADSTKKLDSESQGTEPGAFHVRSFREKPNREVAQSFLDAGRYDWNCGIFLWRAERLRELLAEFQPEIDAGLNRLAAVVGTAAYAAMLETEFPRMPAISIDYGVLEKTREIYVWSVPFEWDDVGSWEALPRLRGADAEGNTVDGLHCGLETRGCIIRGEPGHLVATIGLTDCIVVQTADATLIARKDDEQSLRRLVALLEERGHARFL